MLNRRFAAPPSSIPGEWSIFLAGLSQQVDARTADAVADLVVRGLSDENLERNTQGEDRSDDKSPSK